MARVKLFLTRRCHIASKSCIKQNISAWWFCRNVLLCVDELWVLLQGFSMTSLLSHTLAHSTRHDIPSQWSKWPKFVSLHYWCAPRGARGVKKSGRILSYQFKGVWVQPWSFRGARSQKRLKFRHFWTNLATFKRFLASSFSKTSWLHPNTLKSSSVGSSRFFDTPGTHGGEMLVVW